MEKCPEIEFNPVGFDGILTWFVFSLSALFVSVGAAICCLVAALNFKYRYLSNPDSLKTYFDELQEYHDQLQEDDLAGNEDQKSESLLRDMREIMIEQYLNCGETNRKANIIKANRIYYSTLAIVVSLVILGQSLYPLHVTMRANDNIQKVKIVE